jgi:hypothetical protein
MTDIQPPQINYIKHLTGFFDRIIPERNLNPTHVSLYIALFQFWNINRFQNPISITRDEVMLICKISSKATYHKCMKDLNDKGYIKYEPSYNPFKGSIIFLFDFSEPKEPVQKIANSPKKNVPQNELVMNKQRTSSKPSTCTSTEQALVSSINNINITNNSNFKNDLNLEKQAKIFENENLFFEEKDEKEKSSAKKEKLEILADDNRQIIQTFTDTDEKQTEKSRQKENNPDIDEVKSYFLQQNFPELEAIKFFNYFSSVGWLVGGKIPMVDWQAAAQNWILNAIKFKSYEKPPDRAKHLNTENDKDYGEPL